MNCAEEAETQHYLGRWYGYGPVRDQEQIIFAVFESTPTDNSRLIANSFSNENLANGSESIARRLYTSRAVFDDIATSGQAAGKGSLVGLVLASVSAVRALRIEVPTNRGSVDAASMCVTDLVIEGDHDGHAALGYADLPTANTKTIGRLRAKIRLELADLFSEIVWPSSLNWPGNFCLLLRRAEAIAHVAWEN